MTINQRFLKLTENTKRSVLTEKNLRRSGYTAFLLIAIVAFLFIRPVDNLSFLFVDTDRSASANKKRALFKKDFLCKPCPGPRVHDGSLLATTDGLIAFWYGGSREGARDVSIYQAKWDALSNRWQPAVVVGRNQAQAALHRYIKKLGNAVAVQDRSGKLWLFYVSVSVGGWSGSAINYIQSLDGGKTWSKAKRLVTSPFFNVSTLVKAKPFLYKDGSIGLPAYHEFAGKFSEIIRVSLDGRVLGKQRISHGRKSIQPVVVPLSSTAATILTRNSSESQKLWVSGTRDAGKNWDKPVTSSLANSDSAVTAIQHSSGRLLIVANDVIGSRSRLSLLSSTNGMEWQRISIIEEDVSGKSEYSYPYLIRGPDANYHLLYTWKREAIRHVVFNDTWLKDRKSVV